MTDAPGDTTVTLRIRGRVQGVWFRAWTVEQASQRQLRGWVRNRRDGGVEVLLRGPAAVVEDMIGACWDGPPAARVEAVDVSPAESYEAAGFITLPTE